MKNIADSAISPPQQNGIALVMVLWVLTILMVTVLSFSYMTRTETHASFFFKQGVEKKFLAEAGLERGVVEIFYLIKNPSVSKDAPWKADGTPHRIQADNEYFTVSITDESGKVDINMTSEVILKNMLVNFGLKPEDVDIIADSIMDWKDADDLYRLHGAENDYYMSLPNPYKARNANFETLEELVLVKGITPEILHGYDNKRGIIDFLTVNSKTGKINIFTAPKEILLSIPGMSSEAADLIITLRETGDMQNIQAALGQTFSVIAPYIVTTGSSVFSIDAAGYKEPGKTGYPIKAIVSIERNNKYKFIYYKSPAHLKYDGSDSN